MERESFEDHEIAEFLNKHFISIKVDREERPDIDAIYMNAAQMITGQGGWPLSIFTDSDKRPIYAGTYFPKKDGVYGFGLITLLERIAYLWKNDRAKILQNTIETVGELIEKDNSKDIDYEKIILKGFNQLKHNYDGEYGGFGTAPKFPSPHNLLFLMRYYHCKKEVSALEMAEKTLQCMYNGGIYDHIGFGFSRYSTDRKWLVPHFEKMLYDNALLALAYCEAYHCTKNQLYAKIAEEIFTYIKRNMTSEDGGFYSAEDADSEGEEGKFYVFTKDEIIKLLGTKDGQKFCVRFNVTEKGNFEGANILNLITSEQREFEENDIFFSDCKKRFLAYREKRIRPFKDDKIITSWNGLMICALAYGGRVLNNDGYIEMARKAAAFISEKMTDENGNLYTRYRDGEAKFNGVADDYALLIWGLIELYESTFDKEYLLEAYRLNTVLIDNFWENGALYLNGKDSEMLISRPRELYDGAIPSANSVSISNFIKLSRLCDDHKLAEMAVEIIRFFGKSIESTPYAYSFALCGLMHFTYLSREIVIKGEKNSDFVSEIYSNYNPFATIARADNDIAKDIKLYGRYDSADNENKTHVFICENNVCAEPISDLGELKDILGS